MNELALFAGAGGGILGGHLLGWRTVCAVEYEPYPTSVLVTRQNEKVLSPFPIWDDVCTFDGRPWKGHIDVVSGGFPCQDISIAGSGKGLEGKRSGLWGEMSRIIGEVQPRYVFVENSPMLRSRGLGRVLGDLSEMGFDAKWGCISAADCGAPHKRERIWILATNTSSQRWNQRCSDWEGRHLLYDQDRTTKESKQEGQEQECGTSSTSTNVAYSLLAKNTNTNLSGCLWTTKCIKTEQREPEVPLRNNSLGLCENVPSKSGDSKDELGWWTTEPSMGRVANGMADRVDRLKALGNGQVPRVAATAFNLLIEE